MHSMLLGLLVLWIGPWKLAFLATSSTAAGSSDIWQTYYLDFLIWICEDKWAWWRRGSVRFVELVEHLKHNLCICFCMYRDPDTVVLDGMKPSI